MLGSGPVPSVYNTGTGRRGHTVVYDVPQHSVRVSFVRRSGRSSSSSVSGRRQWPAAGPGVGQVFVRAGRGQLPEEQRAGVPGGRRPRGQEPTRLGAGRGAAEGDRRVRGTSSPGQRPSDGRRCGGDGGDGRTAADAADAATDAAAADHHDHG